MTWNRWMAMALLLGLAGAPAGAQQMGGMHPAGGQGRMMDQGMMQMCGGMTGGGMMSGGTMRGGGMVGHGMMGALLRAADELALTPEQTTRLEALAAETREARQGHMQAIMAARTRATEALSADVRDLPAYESALEEAATHMVQVHVAAARAALDAQAVLTPEQRSKVGEGLRLTGSMMCGAMGGS